MRNSLSVQAYGEGLFCRKHSLALQKPSAGVQPATVSSKEMTYSLASPLH